ncbi:MAG: hypothetical protein H6935_11645 [Thiobacillus sp.]|nr:hypothetical protein [Thiobacillus sp.]
MKARLHPAAFLWGLAEATLFFIVPDVLLSAAALHRLKTALVACAWATAGALPGGLALYLWGRAAPAEAWTVLDRVPAIRPAMQADVSASLAEHGLAALFLGPLTGTPYKLYAVAAGQQGFDLIPFLLASVPARAARFVLVCLLAYTVSRLLAGRFSTPARYGILAACWLVFYGAYFAHMGW